MMQTGAVQLAITTDNCGNYASCRQNADNALHIVLAIGGAVLLIVLAWVIQQTVAQDRLARRGTDATARIEEVTAKPGSRRSNSEVAVYLKLDIPRPDGTTFTAEISAGVPVLEPPRAGWSVPVRYLESKGSFLPRVELRGTFEAPAVEVAPSRPSDKLPELPATDESAALPAAPALSGQHLRAVKPLGEGDPHRLGGFEVLGRIGSGGMGVVYLGRSRGGRLAAVKVVRSELADDAEFRARFGREIVAARQVSGAFTAPVLDADPDAAQPWLATLFIDAPSLRARVGADGPLPPAEVRALGAGLAEALGDLHHVGLVHRDVKPGNVLLAADGPRLIDFGIIRSDGLADLTESGIVLGSAGYLAPEQAEGEPAGPPADVFSLGAVLTFAATGHGPYGTGSAATLLARTLTGEPDLAGLPEGLREVVARCLARDPADRPGTGTVLDSLAG